MSPKLATLGLLEVKVFWNKSYGVVIYVHDVNNKILSRYSKYILDVVMWPKVGNSSIFYDSSYHNLHFKNIWLEKSIFSRCPLGSS